MSNCKVIALTNQKGGVGKTTTAVNLGVSLVQQGKKVLLIDADAQANLTMALGYNRPDDIPITLSTVMQNIIDDKTLDVSQGIIHHREGVDLLPSNIELSGFEVRLINAMSRERVLKTYVNEVKKNYDYVLIDCMPSLGMITINALAAADSVIIPTQPHYLSAKGLELLLRSVSMVKRQINPKLRIDGILMTMVMPRIVMVESNLQRSVILPSEKAFAYKMRLEAMNRQAGRPSKDNLTPMVSDLDTTRTNEKLGKEVGESREQIRRYIRLTELVPEILQMVDERQIAFRPAVEISYLTEEQQYTLLEAMEYNDATPSLAQAIKMKKYNQDGKLTSEVIQSIMEEEKPNQKEKPAFRDERISLKMSLSAAIPRMWLRKWIPQSAMSFLLPRQLRLNGTRSQNAASIMY